MTPAAAFCNVPMCSQQQVDWIADCIEFARGREARTVEATAEAQAKWAAHHDEVANIVLASKENSWYTGANIEGKERRLVAYAVGVNTCRHACDEIKQRGYEGFAMA